MASIESAPQAAATQQRRDVPTASPAVVACYIAAFLLGAIAGTMDWLAIDAIADYQNSLTTLGVVVLVVSHALLLTTLALPPLRPGRWKAALVFAVMGGGVPGLPVAFFLSFGSSVLFTGHYPFG